MAQKTLVCPGHGLCPLKDNLSYIPALYAFSPAPTRALRWFEYPLTAFAQWARHREKASLPGADSHGGSQPLVTWHPVGVSSTHQAFGSEWGRLPDPRSPAARVADPSNRYLPTPRARGRPGPHSRRAAVAVFISYGLDAAGACHSNVAALEAQVYAHHRHGAGCSSGSSPGPAGETGHGPRRGWRA